MSGGISTEPDKPWYASSHGRAVTVALFNIHSVRDEDFRVRATLFNIGGVPPTAEDIRQMLIMRREFRRESRKMEKFRRESRKMEIRKVQLLPDEDFDFEGA